MSIDFIAFDVETANWDRGSICSFGWAEVRDGQVVRTGQQLCRPPEEVDWFSGFNIAIHGITPADVANRPRFDQVVPELLDSFGGLPLVAHNAAFDIGALREAHTYSSLDWPSLSYGCTLVWSRRLLNLPSHRLPVVCDHLGFPLAQHHDAECDANAAANVALALSKNVGAGCLDDLLNATFSRLGRLQPGEWIGCHVRNVGGKGLEIPEANLDADPDNPFYEQKIVFTGGLSCMVRRIAFACVAEAGGIVEKGVTKKTRLLVLGDGFRGDTLGDFLSTSKARKALTYRENGQPIEFWSEIDFVEALMTADVAPFHTAQDGTATLVGEASPRTTFVAPPRAAWQPQESYPGISSPYWRWFEASLSGGSRAGGGEPCRICGESIKSNAAWKFRDRHVCSSACNSTLKRRFKAAISRCDIPDYEEPPAAVELDGGRGRRLFLVVGRDDASGGR